MNIADVLAGRAGLAGVQWALRDPAMQTVLQRVVSALLLPGYTLDLGDLHRAKYKPGRHLTAYYDLNVRDSRGATTSRAIEVSWRPQGSADPRGELPALLAMQNAAVEAGLAAPFERLLADDPATGLYVQVAPLDREFPQLVQLSSSKHVQALLANQLGGLHARRQASYSVTTIRYRPGQRHVLRYDRAAAPAHAEPYNAIFAKIYNSGKGVRSFTVATNIAEWLAAHARGVRAVRPLGYASGDNVVLYPYASGTPLSHLLRTTEEATGAYLRQAGAAIQALHSLPLGVVELQPHSFAKEIKSIASASEHIQTLLPAVGARVAGILERAQELEQRLPHEPPAFAYGDFKADHAWVTANGITLIDFDTCYLADQAIDLGKFLADIHWWYDGYAMGGADAAQEQFLAGYAPTISEERMLHARLYEVLVLTKTAWNSARCEQARRATPLLLLIIPQLPPYESIWSRATQKLLLKNDDKVSCQRYAITCSPDFLWYNAAARGALAANPQQLRPIPPALNHRAAPQQWADPVSWLLTLRSIGAGAGR
jgi:hypothetical protein